MYTVNFLVVNGEYNITQHVVFTRCQALALEVFVSFVNMYSIDLVEIFC